MSFVKTDLELTQRFIKGLKNYNLTAEEIKDWRYVGGGHTANPRINTMLNQVFFANFPGQQVPELENECVCGHPIQLNAFIADDNGNILVLGSCCVQRFVTNGIKRSCPTCKKPYRGTKENYIECKHCRPAIGGQKICRECGSIYRFRTCQTCFTKKQTASPNTVSN